MKKFVLVPDSFKGTLSSPEICKIVSEEIRYQYQEANIVSIPVADGGEGTVEAFLSAVGFIDCPPLLVLHLNYITNKFSVNKYYKKLVYGIKYGII